MLLKPMMGHGSLVEEISNNTFFQKNKWLFLIISRASFIWLYQKMTMSVSVPSLLLTKLRQPRRLPSGLLQSLLAHSGREPHPSCHLLLQNWFHAQGDQQLPYHPHPKSTLPFNLNNYRPINLFDVV